MGSGRGHAECQGCLRHNAQILASELCTVAPLAPTHHDRLLISAGWLSVHILPRPPQPTSTAFQDLVTALGDAAESVITNPDLVKTVSGVACSVCSAGRGMCAEAQLGTPECLYKPS